MVFTIEESLQCLGYASLEDVTDAADLKKRFKSSARAIHPDKGGADEEFDRLLSAYTVLSRVLRRSTGGRDGMSIVHVEDIQEERERQFVVELNQDIHRLLQDLETSASVEEARARFNQAYEEQTSDSRVKDDREWCEEIKDTRPFEQLLAERQYAFSRPVSEPSAVEDDEGDEKEMDPVAFHSQFVEASLKGKPAPTTLILHPEQMAVRSAKDSLVGVIGEDRAPFTAEEYTDIRDAYEADAVVVNKIPAWSMDAPLRTFEQLLAERDMVYTTEEDRDLQMIAAYEKACEEERMRHDKEVKEYFRTTGSSKWALREGPTRAAFLHQQALAGEAPQKEECVIC